MPKLARLRYNQYKRSKGTIGGLPRLINLTQTGPQIEFLRTAPPAGDPAGLYVVGSVEVNVNATTPFSRGKVHKGKLFCPNNLADDGDLVYDRYDDKYYFIMSKKGAIFFEEHHFVDATMYMCADGFVNVYRFTDVGTKDTFGRTIASAPALLPTGTNVRAMFNPQNYDILQQKDRLVAQNKIEICLQGTVGIKQSDRIVFGDTQYIVETVDNTSLNNLVLCGVDTDVR